MHQTKLIQLIRRFDKNEAKQFEIFLASPYFNTSEKLLTFYKILLTYHPDFESVKIDKEKIYKRLHRQSEYNDQTMRELISSLFKLAKEFISHQHLKNAPIEAGNIRFEWLSQKGLVKISEQELTACDEMLGNYSLKDYNYYYHRWVTDYNEYHYYAELMRDVEYKLLKKKDLNHHIHSLNKFYLLRFLESYIYQQNMSKIYNTPLDQSLAGHIDTMAAKYIGQGDQLIDILYNIYQLLKTGGEQHYFELKPIFLSGIKTVPRTIMTELSINLENYCIQKMRSGDKRFAKEIMEIFHYIVEHELMLENGEMPYSFYKNIITMGVEVELEWVEMFAEKYKTLLPAPFRDETYNFCQAFILFANKKYDEALNASLMLAAYNDFEKLDIKNLTARLQYELGMYEQLATLLESYRHHLSRETVTTARKENNMLFLTFMKKLVDLRQQFSAGGLKKLSTEINETPAFNNKSWFMEKMQEMSQAHKLL